VKLRAISKEIPDRQAHCTLASKFLTSYFLLDREYVDSFIRAVKTFLKEHPQKQVAVHCHYGFNRTGFLICWFPTLEVSFACTLNLSKYQLLNRRGELLCERGNKRSNFIALELSKRALNALVASLHGRGRRASGTSTS
jgi:hypothetical protein